MKAFVSGGSGLVGRYIVEELLASGYTVATGGRSKPADDMFSRPVEFSQLDLEAGDDVGHLFDGADCFIHAAFDHLPGRYRGGEGDDPQAFRKRNLEGSVRLFEAAKRAGVRRAVFLSSRAVYDGLPHGAALTEDAELAPSSLYGEVKFRCEQALAALDGPDFVTASLRLTGVYGHLRPNKWDKLVADYLAGEKIPVRAGSEVHGRDVGRAVRLMLESEAGLVTGMTFNVADIVADTRDILAPLATMAGTLQRLPEPADKLTTRTPPTDRIRTLGWHPGGQPLFDRTVEVLASVAPQPD